MKYVISEKQLLNLLKKSEVKDDLEYENVSDANPESDEFVVGKEVDEQSVTDDNPPYPEVPKWGDHGQTPERGPANSLF
jgi:hypothetical protein